MNKSDFFLFLAARILFIEYCLLNTVYHHLEALSQSVGQGFPKDQCRMSGAGARGKVYLTARWLYGFQGNRSEVTNGFSDSTLHLTFKKFSLEFWCSI